MSAVVEVPGKMGRYHRWALNPWTVLACVLAGGTFGWAAPAPAGRLGVVGTAYVDLLQMIVLPFMISAVVFSLQSLYREGGAGRIFQRVVLVFALFSVAAALLSVGAGVLFDPGSGLSEDTRAALGRLVDADGDRNNTVMSMRAQEAPPQARGMREVLDTLIPQNIFAALAKGETLKALVFALLFGFAAGQVPSRLSQGLHEALGTVYHACRTLTRWINLPLPAVLFCMAAAQIAHTGLEPLRVMAGFVATFLALAALLLAAAVLVVARRAGVPYRTALGALREPFALGIATSNSATCMPAMIDGLVRRLEFARARVELLVPLSISLLRIGAVAYVVCGTMFMAALHGRVLHLDEVALLALVAILSGFASAGMTGVVTVTLLSSAAAYLALPFDAAFVLLVAVDPLCAMARTAVTVVTGCAAVASICDEPVKL